MELMQLAEPDSTTFENEISNSITDELLVFPFSVLSENLRFYKDFVHHNFGAERQFLSWLQEFGLLPIKKLCSKCQPVQQMECRRARVIDRWQWSCNQCGARVAVRDGSFFTRIPCSLVDGMKLILAWCEDADCHLVANQLGIKPRVVSMVYDRLDDLAVELQKTFQLGGEDSLVLAEMYPDCLNRLSPDTTDQPHKHRILMLADTNNIPTNYWLYVVKAGYDKSTNNHNETGAEVNSVIATVSRGGLLVAGNCVSLSTTHAHSLDSLADQCDADMRHFLTERVWRQAIALCSASRDLCSGNSGVNDCARAVQRYLHTALYRLRHPNAFYEHTLRTVAEHYSNNWIAK